MAASGRGGVGLFPTAAGLFDVGFVLIRRPASPRAELGLRPGPQLVLNLVDPAAV